ncbi:MAG: TldD/PmbA family protein [Candidatus Zixiibacteriota bacterium]
MFDSEFAEMLIDAALSYGVDAAEVYYCKTKSTEIMAGNGQVEKVTAKSDDGFAARVLKDNRKAFASSNSTDRKAAIDLVKEIARRCPLHSPDVFNVIPEPVLSKATGVKEPFDQGLMEIPLAEKINKILEVEKAAKAYDSRVQGFGWLQYGDTLQDIAVYNSLGVKAASRGTVVYAYAYAIAGDDSSIQTGTYVDASGYFHKLSADHVGRTVAEYAVRMLGAESAKTGEYKLLLPPETSSAFLGALSDMLSADQVQKGKSPFRDLLGQSVAAANVTIIDDGLLPGGLATSLYDSEGMPTEETVLIQNGELKAFLYDSYCAKKGGTKSTGNASRGTYHSQPSISPTNFYLKPGSTKRESLIRSVSDGLYITEVSGLHAAVNPTSADFSAPAKALFVKNGEFAGAADNITLSGNLLKFFGSIEGMADDLAWMPSSGMIGSPTILVSDIKVTGN